MFDAILLQRDSYNNVEILRNRLAQALTTGNLCVVLGAGGSVPYGLPGWEGLVQEMYASQENAKYPRSKSIKIERKVEDFRKAHFKRNYPGYLKCVSDAMYKNFVPTLVGMRNNATLGGVAAMAMMGTHRGRGFDIITFNFDDLLERYLELHGFETQSIVGFPYWAGDGDIRIFHPHGMLPLSSHRETSEKIVFDQISFANVAGGLDDPFWTAVVLAMQTRLCLLIGLSGQDANLDSMLARCRASHVTSGEEHYWAVCCTKNATDKAWWDERGVYAHIVPDYEIALPEFLFSVCEHGAVSGDR